MKVGAISQTLIVGTILMASGALSHGIHGHVYTKSHRDNADFGVIETTRLFQSNGAYDLQYIGSKLDECPVVDKLNDFHAHSYESHEESFIQKVFSALFPFGPAWNAILATAYISGPPNFLLAFIPANIEPSSLATLVAFAIGGLLGDVFLHLLPQIFIGESLEGRANFVLIDEKRNTILGCALFVGFLIFIVLDKGMRILAGGGGHSHSHNHSHSHPQEDDHDASQLLSGTSTSIEKSEIESKEIKNRKKGGLSSSGAHEGSSAVRLSTDPPNSVKLSAYLNLIADFSHNITDGIAISSSFFISKNVGATTCLAVFFHEIPHEVGDFALLIQGGFSKSRAMQAQFVTAIGAFLGTFIGIGLQWLANGSMSEATDVLDAAAQASTNGLFGTTVTVGDLTLPFTAGGFLYIGTVGVIPEILELDSKLTKWEHFKQSMTQMFAMILGIGIMFFISWNE
ncbi:Zip-domain-containing protein [Nadsonia fulvescens var. elongata DSM 6958]|uniref:Zip-domain-containing protein n=1 Tax=Nadsonia fulvescens var. elongata DSM 6958 TaxID=857566 RepID=A0A1E3PQ38_9ASCO|nr:Zip-domain-containing protein [Nadsonia fulvescens var. elongata DSM 6958]